MYIYCMVCKNKKTPHVREAMWADFTHRRVSVWLCEACREDWNEDFEGVVDDLCAKYGMDIEDTMASFGPPTIVEIPLPSKDGDLVFSATVLTFCFIFGVAMLAIAKFFGG